MPRPRPRLLLALSAATLAGVVVSAHAIQDPVRPAMPSFKSSATQVAVTAAVREANGTPVTTLTRNDFEIIDNGEARPITSFWFEPSAASVVVLFDRSGSMRLSDKLDIGRDSVRQLLGWLETGVDNVSLLGFDHDVARLEPFAPAPGRLLENLAHVDAFGTTALLDAMPIAANDVAALRTRRAVVVVTDGLDTESHGTVASVSRFAAGIDVPVYVLVTAPAVDRARLMAATERSTGDLAEIARRTGGEAFVVSTPGDIMKATRTIASDLHHQYLMAFASDGTPGWHALDVRVKQQKLLVRARTGYDAGVRAASH